MNLCIDAGPVENLHRVRGIGSCTAHLLRHIGRVAHRYPQIVISFLSRSSLPQYGGSAQPVSLARRSWTAEWTGISNRVPAPVAEQWKRIDTAFFLPSDLSAHGIDVFLATDPQAIALSHSFRTVAVLYDLIPLLFPRQYLTRVNPLARGTYAAQIRRMRRAHHLIVTAEATKYDAVRLLSLEPQRFSVAPLAVDTELFRPHDSDAARIYVAARYNLQHPFFFYAGAFDYRKNLRTLISAVERLPCGVRLAVAGPMQGPGTRLRRAVERSTARERVVWLDFVPAEDLPYLYSASLALVFPSLYEGFGLPVLEALSSGAPVITSCLSSLPEVAGDAAVYVDPTSVEELTAAMVRLVNDRDLRAELRERGLIQAQKFSWTRTAERVLDICQAVGEGRTPD